MKVVFLQDNGINESLPLTEVSSYLKERGHRTSLLLEREEADLRAALQAENPDLIFIPASVLAHHWVLRACRWLREAFAEVPVVLGGSHPTLFPDILDFPEVQMIVTGEPEEPVAELLEALAGKRPIETIRNLHVKTPKGIFRNPMRPLVTDLDSLPPPDRGLYYDRYAFLADFPWKKVNSSRGCSYACTYCYQPSLKSLSNGGSNKGYVRRKTPRRIVEEIKALRASYRTGHLHMADDLFISDVRWLREFAEAYGAECGLPYSINTTADFITDETARLLADSGCHSVAIGMETVNERVRSQMLHKLVSNDTIRQATRSIRGHGMELVTFNMIAMPGSTLQDAIDTMRFNAELGASYARVSICFPVPGTELARRSLAERLLADGYTGNIYDLPDVSDGAKKVYFKDAKPDEQRYVNLYYLFNWGVTFPALIPAIEKLIHLPPNKLIAAANALRMYKEKELFHLPLADGWKYFRHVGAPDRRTNNFASMVA